MLCTWRECQGRVAICVEHFYAYDSSELLPRQKKKNNSRLILCFVGEKERKKQYFFPTVTACFVRTTNKKQTPSHLTIRESATNNQISHSQTSSVSLNKFCAQSQLKTSFNQLMENRPQLYLMNGSDSAALIHQVWTDETLSDVAECTFTIESNIYTPDQQIGRGIYVSIRRLNFRQAHEECVDYVRFTFGGSKTQRICGDFDGDSKLGRMSHFNEDGGLIKVHIYVNKSQPLLNWNKRSLEIDLVFTAYERKFCHCSRQSEMDSNSIAKCFYCCIYVCSVHG